MINLSVPKKATAVDWLIVGKAEEGKGYLLAGSTKLFSRDNKDRQWFLSSHSRIIIHPSDPKTLSRILISRKPLRLNNITMCRAVGRSENPGGLEVGSNPRIFKGDYFSANFLMEGGGKHSCNPDSDGPECVHTMDGFENASASHYYAVYKTIDY